ncbi:MAG: DUF4382 domain-containing protein [Thiobacillus sp.]|nr:DUF4382 domain-containing protein [Thiobacillus sp.]
MSRFKSVAALLAAGALSLLAGCGGGGGSSSTGTLSLSMTDAPSTEYSHVYVTVNSVRVHQSTDAAEGDAGWSENILAAPVRVDLIALTNGILAELGQAALPAGHYSQMRLVLASNGASAPYANSVVLKGETDEIPLDTPSALQSGLKINVDIDIAPDKVADFVLDFDAYKSVVRRGSSGHYNLKPVITGIPVLSDAGQRVVGFVDDTLATTSTTVSVQSGGTVIKATQPFTADGTAVIGNQTVNVVKGQFVLYPVPAGSYSLVVSSPGSATALITGVPVTITAYTNVGSAGNRILPPTSSVQTASGTVTPANIGASVRALQAYTSGTVVEVASKTIDVDAVDFTLSLPVGAPVYAAYNPDTAAAISFTADDARAGLYTLEASAPGKTTQTGAEINLGSGASTGNDFAF